MIPTEYVDGKSYHLDHFGNLVIHQHSNNNELQFNKEAVDCLKIFLNNYSKR